MADLGAFLSNVALGAGRNIQYGQQMEERQASLDDLKSQTASRKANSDLLQQDFLLRSGIAERKAQAEAQRKKDLEDISTATATRDAVEKSPVETAMAEASMYEKQAKALWAKGHTADAELASKEAKRAADKAKEFGQIAKEQKASRVESLGSAANDVLTAMEAGALTPELAKAYYAARAEAGQPPSDKDYELDSPKGKTELILAAQKSTDVRKLRESDSKIQNAEARTKETHEYHQQLADATRARTEAAAAKQSGSKIEMSDDEIKSAGAQAASGMPLTQVVSGSRAESSAARQLVRAEAIRQIRDDNPELSVTDAGKLLADRSIAFRSRAAGATATARTAGTTATNMEIAGDEARAMITVARQYADTVDAGRFKSLNQLENYARENSGDVPIVQLKASLNSLVNSYARAISPKGVPTVSDKQHARETIDAALSKGQLSGVFDVMDQEMNAAHKAAKGVVDKTVATPGGKSGDGASMEGWTIKVKQ